MIDYKLKRNLDRIRCLFLMLFILPLNNLVTAFCQHRNINVSNTMIILYVLVLIYGISLIIKYSLTKKDLAVLTAIYLFYILMFFISGETARDELHSVYMIIVYAYFVPLSVIVLSHVEDWTDLFNNNKYLFFCDILIVASIVSKVLLNDTTDYMVFSYDLLPIWGIVLISALHFHKKIQWIAVGASLVEALIFGCRGALTWLLLCGLIVYSIDFFSIKDASSLVKRLMVIPMVILTIIIVLLEAIPYLLTSKYADSSYILVRLKIGSLGESTARAEIISLCLDIIKKMGLNIYGLYYDREILPNGMYAHNIILESLLSLGWIFGIIFLIFVFKHIIKAFRLQDSNGKIIWAYFFSVLFMRYFISGSIFGEGKFIMLVAIMISLCRFRSCIWNEEFKNEKQ